MIPNNQIAFKRLISAWFSGGMRHSLSTGPSLPKRGPSRRAGGGMALLLLLTSLGPPWVEANFWEQRRNARRDINGSERAATRMMSQWPASLGDIDRVLPEVNGAVGLGLQSAPPVELNGPATAADLRSTNLPAWLRGLPVSAGEIRGVSLAKNAARAPLAVLIQDVHGVVSAQKNIAQILAHVESGAHKGKQGPLLIGLEGAVGPLDLARYRTYRLKPGYALVSDLLLKSTLLSGPERYGLTAERDPILWGVESAADYVENVSAFVEGHGSEQKVLGAIASAQSALAALGERVLSPDALALDRTLAAYARGEAVLADLARGLRARVPDVPAPEVDRLIQTLAMESALDFARVEKERAALIAALVDRLDVRTLDALMTASLNHRAGRMGFGAYHERLKALVKGRGIRWADYPAFDRYAAYVLSAERIDKFRLFDELDDLKTRAVAALGSGEDEKTLLLLAEDLRLIGRLVRHEFGPADWAIYRERSVDFDRLAERVAERVGPQAAEGLSRSTLDPFERFYRAADRRNDSLTANLLAKARETKAKTVVLVAGGFHSSEIERRLAASGYSIVTVTPALDEVPAGASYLDGFLAKHVPIEEILRGEKLYLSPVRNTADPIIGLKGPGNEGNVTRVFCAALLAVSIALAAEPALMQQSLARNFSATRVVRMAVDSITGQPAVTVASQGATSTVLASVGGMAVEPGARELKARWGVSSSEGLGEDRLTLTLLTGPGSSERGLSASDRIRSGYTVLANGLFGITVSAAVSSVSLVRASFRWLGRSAQSLGGILDGRALLAAFFTNGGRMVQPLVERLKTAIGPHQKSAERFFGGRQILAGLVGLFAANASAHASFTETAVWADPTLLVVIGTLSMMGVFIRRLGLSAGVSLLLVAVLALGLSPSLAWASPGAMDAVSALGSNMFLGLGVLGSLRLVEPSAFPLWTGHAQTEIVVYGNGADVRKVNGTLGSYVSWGRQSQILVPTDAVNLAKKSTKQSDTAHVKVVSLDNWWNDIRLSIAQGVVYGVFYPLGRGQEGPAPGDVQTAVSGLMAKAKVKNQPLVVFADLKRDGGSSAAPPAFILNYSALLYHLALGNKGDAPISMRPKGRPFGKSKLLIGPKHLRRVSQGDSKAIAELADRMSRIGAWQELRLKKRFQALVLASAESRQPEAVPAIKWTLKTDGKFSVDVRFVPSDNGDFMAPWSDIAGLLKSLPEKINAHPSNAKSAPVVTGADIRYSRGWTLFEQTGRGPAAESLVPEIRRQWDGLQLTTNQLRAALEKNDVEGAARLRTKRDGLLFDSSFLSGSALDLADDTGRLLPADARGVFTDHALRATLLAAAAVSRAESTVKPQMESGLRTVLDRFNAFAQVLLGKEATVIEEVLSGLARIGKSEQAQILSIDDIESGVVRPILLDETADRAYLENVAALLEQATTTAGRAALKIAGTGIVVAVAPGIAEGPHAEIIQRIVDLGQTAARQKLPVRVHQGRGDDSVFSQTLDGPTVRLSPLIRLLGIDLNAANFRIQYLSAPASPWTIDTTGLPPSLVVERVRWLLAGIGLRIVGDEQNQNLQKFMAILRAA